jgi:transcription factor MBP1
MASDDQYSNMSVRLHDDDTPDNSTIGSADYLDDDTMLQSADSHKRKRDVQDDSGRHFAIDIEHTLFSDELLDYFLLRQASRSSVRPPIPDNWDPNRPVDDAGHTALHWAAAVADVDTTKELIARGASMYARNFTGLTPLMKAVSYTNNYEHDTFEEILDILQITINLVDHNEFSAFHHAVNVLHINDTSRIGRYYMTCLVEKTEKMAGRKGVEILINMENIDGDTPLHIAARAGSKKFIRHLIQCGSYTDIPNKKGETADYWIGPLWALPREASNAGLTSSPQGDSGQNGSNLPTWSNTADAMASMVVPLIKEKTGKLVESIHAEVKSQNEWEARAMLILIEARNKHAAANRALRGFPELDDPPYIRELQAGRLAELTHNNTILLTQIARRQFAEEDLAKKQVEEIMSRPTPTPTAADLKDKLDTAKEVLEAQKERDKLVEGIVEATGQAGTSNKSAEYQKLLSLTISEPEDQLAKVMPGVLEALEEVDEAEAVPETPK